MAGDFASLDRKLDMLARELGGQAGKARTVAVAKAVAPLVDEAVRQTPAKHGSLADGSMSGWTRQKPIVIVGRVKASGIQVAIEPNAKGPMRVLESGRSNYGVGARRNAGIRVSKKSGLRKQVTRRVTTNVGAHGGKGTWTKATDKIVVAAPPLMRDQVHDAMAKYFVKG